MTPPICHLPVVAAVVAVVAAVVAVVVAAVVFCTKKMLPNGSLRKRIIFQIPEACPENYIDRSTRSLREH